MQSIVSFVIFSLALAYILLAVAIMTGDYFLGMMSGMAMMIIGIYIAIYNVETINNVLTEGIALISIMFGFYIFIIGSKDKIEELL